MKDTSVVTLQLSSPGIYISVTFSTLPEQLELVRTSLGQINLASVHDTKVNITAGGGDTNTFWFSLAPKPYPIMSHLVKLLIPNICRYYNACN